MTIKVEPFKNNIGASISYDLKLTEPKIIDQIKETLNNYGFVCFRDQNLEPGEYLKSVSYTHLTLPPIYSV